MHPDQLKKAPKVFCEAVHMGYTPEYFIVAVSSGSQGTIYTLTPQHAKRLQQQLTHQLHEFEKEHGEVKAEWTPNIVSPVQRATRPPTDQS
jgi:hypothetical protein